MDAMVTARVPVEVKEQVNALLRESGSSPTELVNAAYDYYLRYHELPQVSDVQESVFIELTPEQVDQVRERAARVSCAVPQGFWEEGLLMRAAYGRKGVCR